jgi:hypothetical protein
MADEVGNLIGAAFIKVQAETSDFAGGLESGIKKALALIPGPVALAAGTVAAIGGGLLAIGEKFEGAFNKIAVGTGATGEQLDKLEGDFKRVLSHTAGSFDQVSSAITTLVQRTGLQGQALDDYAAKEVNLGRITKTDVATNVEASTALFNKYGVAVGEQSGKLDELFKASQIGGKGINTLMSEVSGSAPILKLFGYSFDQSVGIVASFEQAGIPAQAAMRGLAKEMQAATKAGVDPKVALTELFDKIKSAPDETAAGQLALGAFGTRAGPALATAIREGKFEVSDLVAKITDGKGGINATATEVSTLGGKFAHLKNMALVAIEPIASAFVGLANDGLGAVLDEIPKVVDWLGKAKDVFLETFTGKTGADDLSGGGPLALVARLALGARQLYQDVLPVTTAIGEFFHALVTGFSYDEGTPIEKLALVVRANLLPILKDVVGFVKDHLGPILVGLAITVGLLVAPWATVAAGVVYLYERFSVFRGIVDGVANFVKDNLAPVLVGLGAVAVAGLIGALPALIAIVGTAVAGFVAWAAGAVAAAAATVAAAAPFIAIGVAIAAVAGGLVYAYEHFKLFHNIVDAVADVLRRVFFAAVDAAKIVLKGLWDYVALGVNVIKQLVKIVVDLFEGDWAGAWHDFLAIPSIIFDGLMTLIGDGLDLIQRLFGGAIDNVVDFFVRLPGRILEALKSLGGLLVDLFARAMSGLWNAVLSGSVALFNFWINLPGQVLGFIGKLPGMLFDLWINALGLVVAAVLTGAVALWDFWKGLPTKVLEFIGKLPGMLVDFWIQALGLVVAAVVTAAVALFDFFKALPGNILALLKSAGSWLTSTGVDLLTGLLNGIVNGAVALWRWFTDLPGRLLGLLTAAGGWLTDAGSRVLQGLWDGIQTVWAREVHFWTDLPGRIGGFFAAARGWLGDAGSRVVSGLVDGFESGAGAVGRWLAGLPGRVISWLGNVGGWLVGAGGDLITGFIHGIEGMAGHLIEAIKKSITDKLPGFVKSALGISSPSTVFAEIGRHVVAGLAHGLSQTGPVDAAMAKLLPNGRGASLTAVVSATAASPGGGPSPLEQMTRNWTIVNNGAPPLNERELVQQLLGVELTHGALLAR